MKIKINIEHKLLVRLLVITLFLATLGGAWDRWWHVSVGRDNFWSPPHIFIYLGLAGFLVLSILGWHIYRTSAWKKVLYLSIAVSFFSPFDELWHSLFGVENLASIWVIWSPPHFLFILGIALSLVFVLPLIQMEKDKIGRIFFTAFALGAIIDLFMFLTIPLYPTGPYEIMGFMGAGIVGGVYSYMLLYARKWLPSFGTIFAVLVFLFLQTVSTAVKIASGVIVKPYNPPVLWLFMFSFFAPCVLNELLVNRSWLKGALFGMVWAAILFGFSSMFFEPQFQYSIADSLTAIISALIGGFIAGVVFEAITKNNLTILSF